VGGGQGLIDVFLTEVAPRGCAADQSCLDGVCIGEQDGGQDGGSEWILRDDTDEDFGLGDPGPASLFGEHFL
jgi:hypothetical protein